MRTTVLLVGLFLAGCGGSTSITGTWSGPVTSTVAGSYTAIFSATQSGDSVTGNYSTSFGGAGSMTGSVSGNTLSFTIAVAGKCTGTLTGSAHVDGDSMSLSYSGTTNCGGYETGTGNLKKQ